MTTSRAPEAGRGDVVGYGPPNERKVVPVDETTQTVTKEATEARDVAAAVFRGLSAGDVSVLEQHVAPDAVDDFVAVGQFHGRASIRGFFEELFTAFPDFRLEVDRIVGDGDVAVVQWEASGTFTGGPFQGIEPTGRHVSIRGVDVMEIHDGQVHHNTIYYDGAAFARQVGMLPRDGSIADKVLLTGFNAVTRLRSKIRGSEETSGETSPPPA
jgi:steroid delta-isomerase-like uncharacterized protein